MRTCIVIPAYNEAQRIGEVLDALIMEGLDLVVVDDGSTDDTAEVARSRPVHFLQHAVNLGQGAALKTGTEYAQKLGYENIIHFDADGQHRIEDLKKVIAALEQKECDVVLGSRFLEEKTEFPLSKRVILGLAKIFSKQVLQLQFSDPQCGLRGLRSSALSDLNWQKPGFQHSIEILNLISKNKINYQEIPVKVNYDAYSCSKSVKPRVSMGLKILIDKFLE